MTTTAAAPATTERPAMGKTGTAKPNGQSPGLPGQFAALLLQADEEPVPLLAGEALAPDTETVGKGPQDSVTDKAAPTGADTAQQMLQALMGWRSVPGSSQPANASATQPRTDTGTFTANTDGLGISTATATMPEPSAPALPPPATKSTDTASNWISSTSTALHSAALERATNTHTTSGTQASANPSAPAPSLPPPSETGSTQAQMPVQALASDNGSASPLMGKGKALAAKVPGVGNVRPHAPSTTETGAAPTLNAASKPAETAAHVRSTVDLVAHTNAIESPPETAATEHSGAPASSAVLSTPGTPNPTGEGLQQADTGRSEPNTPVSAEYNPVTETFSHMFQQHMDEVGSHISYWTSQGAQRASFTVGSAQDMPVEVTMSFSEGSLNVAFETEESHVRELLETNAQEALQQLMDAQGIALGSVSVNGERPRSPPDHSSNRSTVEWAQRGSASNASAADVPPPPVRRVPQIMTATKLDFFA